VQTEAMREVIYVILCRACRPME